MWEIIVTSSVLILAVLAVRAVFRNKLGLRARYALWAVVALRLLLPVSLFSSPVSVMNAVEAAASVRTVRPGPEREAAPGPYGEAAESGAEQVPEGAGKNLGEPAEEQLEPKQPAAAPKARTEQAWDGTAAVKAVWLAGVLATAACLCLSNLRFQRGLKRRAARVELPEFPLPVYRAEGIPSPCLYGVFRPAVYLTPESFAGERRLRHILAHEYTHFRHGDHLWSLVRSLCLAAYWFNPLVWLAAALSRRDCELACDEGALRRLGEGERLEYGRTLVALVSGKRENLLCGATTMTSAGKSMKERLSFLVRKPRRYAPALCLALAAVLCAAGCTFTGAAKPAGPDAEELAEALFAGGARLELEFQEDRASVSLDETEQADFAWLLSQYDWQPGEKGPWTQETLVLRAERGNARLEVGLNGMDGFRYERDGKEAWYQNAVRDDASQYPLADVLRRELAWRTMKAEYGVAATPEEGPFEPSHAWTDAAVSQEGDEADVGLIARELLEAYLARYEQESPAYFDALRSYEVEEAEPLLTGDGSFRFRGRCRIAPWNKPGSSWLDREGISADAWDSSLLVWEPTLEASRSQDGLYWTVTRDLTGERREAGGLLTADGFVQSLDGETRMVLVYPADAEADQLLGERCRFFVTDETELFWADGTAAAWKDLTEKGQVTVAFDRFIDHNPTRADALRVTLHPERAETILTQDEVKELMESLAPPSGIRFTYTQPDGLELSHLAEDWPAGQNLSYYRWTEFLGRLDRAQWKYRVDLEAADGSARLSVYEGSPYVETERDGRQRVWLLEPKDQWTTAVWQTAFLLFDDSGSQSKVDEIPAIEGEDREDTARRFMEEKFLHWNDGHPPGSDMRILGYAIVELDVGGEGFYNSHAFVFSCTYSLKPEIYKSAQLWAGNTKEDKEREGWLRMSRQYRLELADGVWTCTASGGGVGLDG